MADDTELIETAVNDTEDAAPHLTPIDFDAIGYIPGEKAPWRCTKYDCYGPDELGELKKYIDDMVKNPEQSNSSARLWEINQAWLARLFRRNYQFNIQTSGGGWELYGAGSGGKTAQASQDASKMFPFNVYGARHKKIVALLSREVPPVIVVPEDEEDTQDQQAAQEATPYLKAFREQAKVRRRMADAASYLYTDGSAVFMTYTVASKEFGQEIDDDGNPVPARQEVVEVFGKLERAVPLQADTQSDMGWIKLSRERSRELLRARYPWIRSKITSGTGTDQTGQMDKLARTNVRLAVQTTSASGAGFAQDATESVVFLRPYQYESCPDETMRQMMYDEFPSGMEVWTAAGEIALVREGSIDSHVAVCHATPGDGQNRESIGTNYLPIQKILNATISLYDRYFRATVPRRFVMEPYIDAEAMRQRSSSPDQIVPVDGASVAAAGMTLDGITAIEKTPQPSDAMLAYIQWLATTAAETMDGGTPAIFGTEADASDKGTFGEARLDRDQALQVFSLPWGDMAMATAEVERQAIISAAENRISDFSVGLPGERVRVSISKLAGKVLVWPTSTEIPPTLAEQQAEVGNMLSAAATVPLYASIVADPRNLEVLRRMPSLTGMKLPGLEDVEAQIEDNQKLLSEQPLPNPQIAQLEQQIQQLDQQAQMQASQVQDPMQRQQIVQQAMQQVQQLTQQLQQLQQTTPLVSSVTPRPDASVDHGIRAAIAQAEMNSARGRAMENGDEQQKLGFQNLHLNWQEHSAIAKSLQPPPPIPFKASFTGDVTKLPPAAQSIAYERLGLMIPPVALQPDEATHEITEKTEGLDPTTGTPTERTISVAGKPLNN